MFKREHRFRNYTGGLIIVLFLISPNILEAQTASDTLPPEVTLTDCINFALNNQPGVRQSLIDEKIAGKDIGISLSDWYPQLNADGNLQHYIRQSSGTSSANTASGVFSASQTIYSSRLLFNARSAGAIRNQAAYNTEDTRINTYVDVTKAFFDVLLTKEQINVLDEAILRLQRNYTDAYNLYVNGLTDKTDYQRTQIALSNTHVQRRTAQESLKAKYSILKQLMGVDPQRQIAVSYDTANFEKEILVDTMKIPDYTRRVEYRQLETAMRLQNLDVGYSRWSFLPTVSAFYNYNMQYSNDSFRDLFITTYPSSVVGLRLSLPLFSGLNRIQNLGRARLQYQRLELGMYDLKSRISSEYTIALARYTSDMNELNTARKNIALAKDIFNTVRLQYEKGIKAYLEVIVSETDLRTAELNYLNTLFGVLSSKLDLEKALGEIRIN
jgi:outer membrane protein TolC